MEKEVQRIDLELSEEEEKDKKEEEKEEYKNKEIEKLENHKDFYLWLKSSNLFELSSLNVCNFIPKLVYQECLYIILGKL